MALLASGSGWGNRDQGVGPQEAEPQAETGQPSPQSEPPASGQHHPGKRGFGADGPCRAVEEIPAQEALTLGFSNRDLLRNRRRPAFRKRILSPAFSLFADM